ncbi:hypothetical protein HDU99_000121, partial [Rhizoclosmatium hyalinum]
MATPLLKPQSLEFPLYAVCLALKELGFPQSSCEISFLSSKLSTIEIFFADGDCSEALAEAKEA